MKKGTGWSDNDTSERDKREYEAAVRAMGRAYMAGKEQIQASVDQLENNESVEPSSVISLTNKQSQKPSLATEMTSEAVKKTIKKEGEKYVLYSQDGSKKLGEFESEEKAMAREKQINYFKYINKAFNLNVSTN